MPIPEARRQAIEFSMGHDPHAAHRRQIAELEKRLTEAEELISEMIGLDKGPDEEEYGEWDDRAREFLFRGSVN